LDRIKRFGLIAAVAAIALLVPTRAASETPTPIIEVYVSLAEMPPAIVNVSVPEHAPIVNLDVPRIPAPTVNVEVIVPEGQAKPDTVVIQSPPEIVYQDREVVVEVPVETVVEVPVEVIVERTVEVPVEVIVEREVVVVCNPTDGRERSFAFIDDGVITNVGGGSGPDFENYLKAVADRGMEITCLVPMPWIGWTFDGSEFAPPESTD
jgi:hypothetical protein